MHHRQPSVPLPVTREETLFGRGEPGAQVPEECWLLLAARDPPIVQVEPTRAFLDRLSGFGGLEFPLDLPGSQPTSAAEDSEATVG